MALAKQKPMFSAEEHRQLGRDQIIAVRFMFKDESYGRHIRPNIVRNIAKTFSWLKFGRPLVSLRKPYHYAVIDGNHRIMAVRQLFGDHAEIPCIVYENLKVSDESVIFSDTQSPGYRTQMLPHERFKADRQSGRAYTQNIDVVLAKYGLRADASGNGLEAVRSIAQLIKLERQNTIANVISVLHNAWHGKVGAYSQTALASTGSFVTKYRNADQRRLVKVMSRRTPEDLTRAIFDTAQVIGGGNSTVLQGRRVLAFWYNAGLRADRRLVVD